ncbi:MAG: hypothetical protein K8F25_12785, partial [Fimbriimonadaceae bacterium]|nr:hypothetical protein [Alphaproteobacteria bacterium]
IPPIALLAVASLSGHGGLKLVGQITEFDVPYRRLIEAWHLMDTGSWFPSVLFLGVTASYMFYLLWRRVILFSSAYAVTITLLVALFFCLPNQIFNTHYVVMRIALGATFLAIASGIPTEAINTWSSRYKLFLILIITLGLSSWQAMSSYHSETARRDYTSLIQDLPEGNSLFMAHAGISGEDLEYDRLGIYHLGTFAVIERKAMVQNMFANPAQQPISYFRPDLNNGGVFLETLAETLEDKDLIVSEHISQFDWIVTHGPDPEIDARYLPLDNFLFTRKVGNFRLYCNSQPVRNPLFSGKPATCQDLRDALTDPQ